MTHVEAPPSSKRPMPSSKTHVSLQELGLHPSAVKSVWEAIKQKPNHCAPKLYQHGPAFELCSKDPACLSAQMMLLASGIEFTVVNCNNNDMSPSGELPFLRLYNDVLHVGTSGVQTYLSSLKKKPEARFDTTESGSMIAYAGLITSRLTPAYLYELWCEEESFEEVARPFYGVAHYPWPLDFVLCKIRQFTLWQQVFPIGQPRSEDKLFFEAGCAYKALSEQLLDKPYLFGDQPTFVDALAYGHIAIVLKSELPSNKLKSSLINCKNLLELCERIENEFPKLCTSGRT